MSEFLLKNVLPNCTMVSACYSFKHIHPGARSVEDLQKTIVGTLDIPAYMVIYCDEYLESFIRKYRDDLGMALITCIRKIPFEEIWAYPLLEKVKRNRSTYWPTWDSRTNAETHIITCNKIDFLEKTILDNPFPTTRFAWIDGCLDPKLGKICEDYSHAKMMHLMHNINDKFHIQILNVCHKKFKNPTMKAEYYYQYRWVVCGGFFTCGAEIGLKVAERVKEITVDTTEAGFGHGEEMFYLEILDEFYHDIERSYGDYGQIIDNFIQPQRNFNYILNNIIRNYANNYQYYRECYDCCEKVLKAIETFTIKDDYYLWTEVYYYYFLSAFYVNREEARLLVSRIRAICDYNPYFKSEFDKRRDFYESKFAMLNQ
jgi:hypothetical protein